MHGSLLVTLVALAGFLGAQSQTTPAMNCGQNPADIVFLLDSSGSVTQSNFQKMLDFVTRFAQTFDIGPRNVQIGVVTFSNVPHNEFNLNTYSNKNDLLSAVHKIHYIAGGTRTDLALQYIEANSFTRAAGDRDQVANILIVMTDGQSNVPTATLAETVKLHKMNMKVFAIGIGTGIDHKELGNIASDAHHVFTVTNFDALNTLQTELKKTACKIDGGWSAFGSYSPCTLTCNGGTRFHERSCTNPRPANGGNNCTGNARETEKCNEQPCPTLPPTTTPTTHKTTSLPTTTLPPPTLASGCNTTVPADIAFILDASGSVGPQNFNTMLEFVKKMVDGFPVGPTGVHIAVVTFDSKTYLQFHLNKFTDKNAIKTAVSNTRYTSGTTHTAEAIQYVRTTVFTPQNGMRPDAAKIAIIITDGQSNSPAATASEADLLRKMGITVFSIGVGSSLDVKELNAMATDPDNTHVLQVTNFNSLDTIKGSLSTKTCEQVKATSPPTTTVAPRADCEAQADIMFLLDSSGSVGTSNFQKMKTFVHDLMNSFNIGPNAVQVGVDTFDSTVRTEFNLNSYHDRPSLQAAINRIPYLAGSTETAKAIKFMRDDSFNVTHGDRPNVPNVAIIVTDGQSNNPSLTAQEAQKARDSGIIVLAIGVGSGINKNELNAMATDPDSTHVFMADNFDALKSLKAMLSTKACEVSKPTVNETAPNCAAKADILYILDSSGSIGQTNYGKMLTFVRDLTSKFDVGPDKIQIATEIFSDRTYVQFNLNQHQTQASVDQAISNIPYMQGGTNTGQALKDAYEKMFTAVNGDRANVTNIVIVITDGLSNNRAYTIAEARKLQDRHVQVFAVGVGSGVDTSELNAIASDPDNLHVLTVTDFSQLAKITASLNNQACNATAVGYGVTPSSFNGSATAPSLCQDQNPNCRAYDIPAVCTDYAGWAKDNCQQSCGFCPSSNPTSPPPCVNAIANCNEYSADACTNFKPWAMDNCRQFCGFCQLGSSQQVVTGFFGKCYYNGKTYSQGQTWDDGCSYTCSCDDASNGKYSCYNKCPVYYNLPPQCTLVPKGTCCLEPVCDFHATHLTTNGQTAGKYNGVSVCMYNGAPYYQGQSWQDGCDKTCFCQDGALGLYTCQSLCGHYTQLPSECQLQTPVGKCCEEPVCTFNKQFGQFTGAGSQSGKGSGMTVQPTQPPCVDKDLNCVRYPNTTCTDPQYHQWAIDNCAKFCRFCGTNVAPTPGPTDMCIYGGKTYHQGQKWDDGCELECVCENAIYGFYRCQKKCADIVNLPLGCKQVKNAEDCCSMIQCTGTSGSFVSSQTISGTNGGAVPILIPTPGPGMTVTGGPGGMITGQLNGCLYKGTFYALGRRWDDGCDYTCVCESAQTGQYKCTPKCPSFDSLPAECHLQDNPNDPCCRVPVCTGTPTSVPIPTYGKGFTGYGRPAMPNSGGGGVVVPGAPTAISGTGRGCVYDGHVYMNGMTWDQGCQYRCECIDEQSGQYRCTERCTMYTNIPPQCTLAADPKDACCKAIHCDFTKPVTTIAPLFALTTPQAGGAFCEYQGYYHRQGETWNDGCGLTCRCEDAVNRYYQCTDRCPKYENIPSSCTFVPDPKDPQCCRVPQCQDSGSVSGSTGFMGSFTGYGRPPNIDLNTLQNTGYRQACLYKGQIYQQGVSWEDGCDYQCECTDATKGMYKCTEKCQRIASIPNGCHLDQDPNDHCCQTLKCDPTSQLGVCKDILNCAAFGTYVCGENYKEWATQNCAKYCGYCGGGANPLLTISSSNGSCSNTIPNCDQYGNSVCTDPQYKGWVNSHCVKFCNACGSISTGGVGGSTRAPSGTVTGSSTSGNNSCADVLLNCQEYTQSACRDPYVDWAKKNCARYCGYCDAVGGTGTGMIGTGTGGTGTGTGGSFTGSMTIPPGSGFTGFSGGCVYNGRYYGAGDKWLDGCQYNCTCENGHTGFYRCIDRCPTYNLAAGCVLKKTASECCGVPDCSGAGTGSMNGTGGTMTGHSEGCFYNNVNYQQGQSWRDGCKYKCTCMEGATGRYTCTALCLNWQLPASCHLNQPAPGKCCETPNCPPEIVLEYPPGYVPE